MRAVIFDLYETLVTENHPEWFGRPSLADGLGIDAQLCRAEWRTRYQRRMTGQLADYGAVIREICAVAGATPSVGLVDRLAAERLEAKARPFRRLAPAVVELLELLRERGLKLGVISNCTADEVAAWPDSPLPGLVDAAVFSYQVGVMKPAEEIYAFACTRLGVATGDAWYVGDGGSDELRGARAAGLWPVWSTWFIEQWPWDWPANVAATAGDFPRCRTVAGLPDLLGI